MIKTRWSAMRRICWSRGYAPGYVHMLCSAVKGFLSYLEEGELPLVSRLPLEDAGVQPELTRKEYLRLLSAAKAANRECAYMLVKLFATTGIAVRELPRVTVEAVKQQRIVTFPNRVRQEIRIPSCVQKELLGFCQVEQHSRGASVSLPKRRSPSPRLRHGHHSKAGSSCSGGPG